MNFEFLSRTFLFQGTSPEETQHMLSCLNAEPKSYPKGSVICQVGDQMKAMGLVLSGSVHIESIDMMGNKTILNRIAPGQVFGETYACIPGEKLLVRAHGRGHVAHGHLILGHLIGLKLDFIVF